ncbi:hypothetical protein BDV41DRAFT_529768 [Aspergillus transmontanensis]|uniref:Uncharacterized protein n=1 Tax=Aspergillus transmontanensis TaxID=1034304 RepID=A0A5N6W4F3_9EURO|nr:hypothetical protein BDV41DRAFT_529768 [Aspergillus transmontanensis]
MLTDVYWFHVADLYIFILSVSKNLVHDIQMLVQSGVDHSLLRPHRSEIKPRNNAFRRISLITSLPILYLSNSLFHFGSLFIVLYSRWKLHAGQARHSLDFRSYL